MELYLIGQYLVATRRRLVVHLTLSQLLYLRQRSRKLRLKEFYKLKKNLDAYGKDTA